VDIRDDETGEDEEEVDAVLAKAGKSGWVVETIEEMDTGRGMEQDHREGRKASGAFDIE